MATNEAVKMSSAVTLGFIGGVFGVVTGFLAMFFGGFGMLFDVTGGIAVVGLGLVAVACGLAGVVGGVLLTSRPALGTWLMAVAGIAGFFAVTVFWVLPGLLLLGAAFIAYRASHFEEEALI